MLKPMLARGELQTIGATHHRRVPQVHREGRGLERRFQPIQVHEPTIAETIEIPKGLRSSVTREPPPRDLSPMAAMSSAAEPSSRYIQDRNLLLTRLST